MGVNDQRLQRKLLEISDLDYTKAVDKCRTHEATSEQMTSMNKTVSVNAFEESSHVAGKKHTQNRKQHKSNNNNTKQYKSGNNSGSSKANRSDCANEGRGQQQQQTYNTNRNAVSAYESNCEISDNEEFLISSIEKVYAIEDDEDEVSYPWIEKIWIGGQLVAFKIDTGAQVNVIPLSVFLQLRTEIELHRTNVKLRAFSGEKLKPVGMCSLLGKFNKKSCDMKTAVVDIDIMPILGLKSCIQFGLVSPTVESRTFTNTAYQSLGCFNSEYKISVDKNATPIAHAPRRVPLAIRHRLKMKLDELVANKIIEKATGYCEWVNHLVTVEKKDAEKSLRLCIDPGELNKSIFNEHAFIPTFEDVSSQLNGMKYFTVLDLKDGYWHVKLDEESKKLCTFATPYGNYRFLRLPFGIKTAPGVFQQLNFENFGDIENVMIYFDDILIVGRTRKEHDEVLKKVLDRAREKNVRFNINKAQIALEEVKYLGHIFSYNQIKPDPERLLAIAEMTRPKNKNDLQTFLGVVNFMTPFIPNLSDRTAPLRELIKKNVLFLWTECSMRSKNAFLIRKFSCLSTFQKS
ncbi:uncharacterized protein K02A2.6-like [Sitodiplosis mosellana]|uniref:uncharacterized protein K02A2.6-like n=1 Tax=Sitodiplosis mosellana TaxID=263140 RepID=UPI0024438DE1|nr:uncharacterized protein K02A2.6-like [Sitodiplosis mosellana]